MAAKHPKPGDPRKARAEAKRKEKAPPPAKQEQKEKKKVGRPKWIPPDLAIVEKLAAQGLTKDQIADALGIGKTLLYATQAENSEFAEAIKRGQAKGISIVASKLMEQVQQGNVTAQIFYMKCRAGWRDQPAPAVTVETDETNKTKVTITDLYKQMNAD